MRRAFMSSFVVLVLLIAVAGCRTATNPAEAETQRRFGVQMAKMNLWREAAFRFRRAVEMNPNDAMAYNNLAVAHEANGDFDSALKAYREALRLDRSNQYIAKNYSRFVEFTSRDKKRPSRVTTTTAGATSTATPTTTTQAPTPAAAAPPPAEPGATAPPATTTTNPPEVF